MKILKFDQRPTKQTSDQTINNGPLFSEVQRHKLLASSELVWNPTSKNQNHVHEHIPGHRTCAITSSITAGQCVCPPFDGRNVRSHNLVTSRSEITKHQRTRGVVVENCSIHHTHATETWPGGECKRDGNLHRWRKMLFIVYTVRSHRTYR